MHQRERAHIPNESMIPVHHGAIASWRTDGPIACGLAAAALFSGVALLAHILTRLSLRVLLSLTAVLMVSAVTALYRRSGPRQRVLLGRYTMVGLISGIMATAGYDLSKFALTQGGQFPYNPFEVIRTFGVLLAGSSAPLAVIYGVGTGLHILNGTCFGIAFCLPFGRRGIVAGIAWGFFLETLQLTLFPGWLDIRAYREFAQISALSHVVYGSILGWCCQRGLSTWGPQVP